MRIAAIVVGQGVAQGAVAKQRHTPETIATHPGPWHRALSEPLPSADWIWLVRGDTAPAPDALEQLAGVAVGRPGLAEPVLLASKVLGPGGALEPGSAPWPPLHDRQGAMDAAEERLAAVRIARWGSLLVRADALRRHAPPRSGLWGGEDIEFTGRLLREGAGYLVPASVTTRDKTRGARRLGTLRAAASREAWDTQERLWVIYTALLEGSRPSPSRTARPIVATLSRLARLVRR